MGHLVQFPIPARFVQGDFVGGAGDGAQTNRDGIENCTLGGFAFLWIPPASPGLPNRPNQKGVDQLFCRFPVEKIEMIRPLHDEID